jgi:hypothetical protein
VYYELSRVLAACCEAVYLYCMMRWVVFRDTRDSPVNAAADEEPAAPAPQPTTLPRDEQSAPR